MNVDEREFLNHSAALLMSISKTVILSLWLGAAAGIAAKPGAAPPPPCVLEGEVSVACASEFPGVNLAVADLMSDLEKVLGRPAVRSESGDARITVKLDPSLPAESFRIESGPDGLALRGADELGIIYAVYHVSREILGVDPCWWFKDLEPERQPRVEAPAGTFESGSRPFRYRGWFINDEDLMTEWKDDGGARHIRYPFYSQVTHPELLDRVFEAALRSGANLVIPCSFVDVMNEPEANVVKQAARRGLYVTQHHIEPLGVSHFGFENFWAARGEKFAFSYGSEPDRVRETWRAFANRWSELAGDKVVWQLGLRGKGDAAIWQSDKSVSRAAAGEMISRAIAEQREIVLAADRREAPPMTTTLWAEGSELMAEGALIIPGDVAIVFADEGKSQRMQEDFFNTPRDPDRNYGVYYHIAFWATGPHLLPGTVPSRVAETLRRVIEKGDTHYAIINVCNVREHILGIQAATGLMTDPAWTEAAMWDRFAPQELHGLYRSYLASLIPIDGDRRILQDGDLWAAAKKILAAYNSGKPNPGASNAETRQERIHQLRESVERLDQLVRDFDAVTLDPREAAFHRIYLRVNARLQREMQAFYLALLESSAQPAKLADAEAALERFLEIRKEAATGKWENWFRGDKKVNVPRFLEETRKARKNAEPK